MRRLRRNVRLFYYGELTAQDTEELAEECRGLELALRRLLDYVRIPARFVLIGLRLAKVSENQNKC